MKKILIIDYNSESNQEIETILSSENFGTYFAEDGYQGIEIAKIYCPDLIICDVKLNGIDGFYVKQKLNEIPETRIIPFVFLSGNASIDEMSKCFEFGADSYIQKPLIEENFVNIINSVFNKIEIYKEKFSRSVPTSIDETESHTTRNDHILVKIGRNLRLISFNNIICVKAQKEYSEILCENKQKVIIRKSIRKWCQILPESMFLRIHRATIINTNFIEKAEKISDRSYKVYLKNVAEPMILSQRYAKYLRKVFIS